MNLRLIRYTGLLLLTLTSSLSAAALNDPLQKGKDYYFSGEFKHAISQFELMMRAKPDDPEPYLWLGRSYVLLADLKPPVLATRARLKARMYLAKAVTLGPECAECRSELLDLLLTSDNPRLELRDAKLLLANMPESDPERASMQSLLEDARKQRSSPESLIIAVVGFPSQTLAGLHLRPLPATEPQQFGERSRASQSQRDANRRSSFAGE